MSHYHLEILFPPNAEIESAVAEVLAPFDENSEESYLPFWDFYVIGGRWAGAKQLAMFGEEKVSAFRQELFDRNVTVSIFQAGKQSLEPSSQIPMVDKLWKQYFPNYRGKHCPLFKHSNDQYSSDSLISDDIADFADVPPSLSCERLIIAGRNYGDTKWEAEQMLVKSFYNGCTHQDTTWSGLFGDAVAYFAKALANYAPDYRKALTPVAGWQVVTVDYHS